MAFVKVPRVVWTAIFSLLVLAATGPDKLNLRAGIQPVPFSARFEDPGYFVWCGAMVHAADGKFHLFYSRWPKRYGFNAWVTHSEVAHAIGNSALGTFHFVNVALPARGDEFWDGSVTHDPTIIQVKGRYYLYYMGDYGEGADRWDYRNHQRIGVAVADSPDGPWKRFDQPVVDVSSDSAAPDSLCVTDPSVTERPDGGFLMIYKAVGRARPLPFGGPVVHLLATAKSPTGPFVKQLKPMFALPGTAFAEDPFVWYQKSAQKYYLILKDTHGLFTQTGRSTLTLFTSLNGLDWNLANHPIISDLTIRWKDGTTSKVRAMERPQLFFEGGKARVLLCAVDDGVPGQLTYNLRIPLRLDGGI